MWKRGMPMFTIKKLETDEEIKALARLANIIWHEHFPKLISKEQIDYMLENYQSEKAIMDQIKKQGYTYYLGYVDDELIGYCGVCPEADATRLFLSKLYVRKDQRGHGYARQLFNETVKLAKSLNIHAIYLTCNKFNEHSLAVYDQMGFHTIDAVQTEIGSGFIMDDYIMQYDL